LAHGEQQAEQWIGEGLKIAGLDDSELAALVGSDVRKVALAKLAWKKTTVSQGWIAKHLAMGSPANVSQALSRMSWEDLEKIATGPEQIPPAGSKPMSGAHSCHNMTTDP
jgi:hypothetical protein